MPRRINQRRFCLFKQDGRIWRREQPVSEGGLDHHFSQLFTDVQSGIMLVKGQNRFQLH